MQQPDPMEPKRSLELWFECHKKKVSLGVGGGEVALRERGSGVFPTHANRKSHRMNLLQSMNI